MGDLLCVDDFYPPSDIDYMNKHGVVWPKADVVYSIRAVINFPVGEKGILLNEILNPSTPKISPSFGMQGISETAWKISRFRNIDQTEINLQELNSIKERS